jgi:CHRD domain
MKHMAKLALLTAVILQVALPAEAQAVRTFKARLSPVPLDVAMQATVSGSGSVTATLTGTRLVVNGTFEGLKSPATIVQIHKGQRGVRGPAILDLKATNGTSGTISGEIDLSRQQVENLQKSWLYVQLHSEKAPDGNLWGWLLPQETRK